MSRATVESFSLPLAAPLDTAAGSIERREGFLFRAGDGCGEATPLPGWTESLDRCRENLDAASAAFERGGFGAALDAVETPAARHAVALARDDAAARYQGMPLYRALGATERVTGVPVNATLGDAPAAETAEDAREAVEEGFTCLKVKVGVRPLEADVERLRAVREAAGDVTLRADANGAWDRATAREALERLAPLDVAYVEQPLSADDLAGHADLRGGAVGVALDESLRSHALDDVLSTGAADVVVLKPMALGGVDRAREAALRARDAGVSPVVTTTIDAVVARTAAVHLAASIPAVPACGLATARLLAADLASDPAPVADGVVRVPQSPGVGVDP